LTIVDAKSQFVGLVFGFLLFAGDSIDADKLSIFSEVLTIPVLAILAVIILHGFFLLIFNG
jgi:hypothetical protein